MAEHGRRVLVELGHVVDDDGRDGVAIEIGGDLSRPLRDVVAGAGEALVDQVVAPAGHTHGGVEVVEGAEGARPPGPDEHGPGHEVAEALGEPRLADAGRTHDGYHPVVRGLGFHGAEDRVELAVASRSDRSRHRRRERRPWCRQRRVAVDELQLELADRRGPGSKPWSSSIRSVNERQAARAETWSPVR